MKNLHATLNNINESDGGVILSLNEITKTFGTQAVLDKVNLTVRKGTVHALLGENGAGKSTLLKILTGVYKRDAGRIEYEGQEIIPQNPKEALRVGISIVHQNTNIIENLSVEENIWLGRRYPALIKKFGVIDWKQTRASAVTLLGEVGLSIDPKLPAAELSPDQIAMLAIARAIGSGGRLIILDEPTVALMPREVAILFAHMRRLKNQGYTFVYVTHRLEEVLEIADDITILRDGGVVWAGNKQSISRKSIVEHIAGKELTNSIQASVIQNNKELVTEPNSPILSVASLSSDGITEVSLELRRGEILGIAGLPGSGAEELLEVLYGARAMVKGSIQLEDRQLILRNVKDAVKAGIAFVPKDRLKDGLISNIGILGNITIAALDKFISDPLIRFIFRRRELAISETLRTELSIKMTSFRESWQNLSGGNQQKVLLGRALCTDCRILLLSSPTAAVDVGAKAEIYQLLRQLTNRGVGVFMSSVDLDEMETVCDRVIVMKEGKQIGELKGEQLKQNSIWELLMNNQ